MVHEDQDAGSLDISATSVLEEVQQPHQLREDGLPSSLIYFTVVLDQ